MTKKRFTHKKWYNDRELFDGDESFAIVDVYIQAEEICNKLNELADENTRLKHTNQELYDKLQVTMSEKSLKGGEIAILQRKNKELKEELRVYRKIATCDNCTYHNYDWFDDGDEFEVCDKGNNEQQIDYHICKDWEEL